MERIQLKKKRFTRRKLHVKRNLHSQTERPRLCIFRSNKNLYAQIIDDSKGHTLVAASTIEKGFPEMKNRKNIEAAKILGGIISERAIKKKIKKVIFDRSGYLYHGRIKAFADTAREKGLEF